MLQKKIQKPFFLANNKLLIKFFKWLHFPKEVDIDSINIIKLKGFNCFLIDNLRSGSRETSSPVWNKEKFKWFWKRILKFIRIKTNEN